MAESARTTGDFSFPDGSSFLAPVRWLLHSSVWSSGDRCVVRQAVESSTRHATLPHSVAVLPQAQSPNDSRQHYAACDRFFGSRDGSKMSRSNIYGRKADELRAMAPVAETEMLRAGLVEIADQYEALAAHARVREPPSMVDARTRKTSSVAVRHAGAVVIGLLSDQLGLTVDSESPSPKEESGPEALAGEGMTTMSSYGPMRICSISASLAGAASGRRPVHPILLPAPAAALETQRAVVLPQRR
jgi:hypothetical protein